MNYGTSLSALEWEVKVQCQLRYCALDFERTFNVNGEKYNISKLLRVLEKHGGRLLAENLEKIMRSNSPEVAQSKIIKEIHWY